MKTIVGFLTVIAFFGMVLPSQAEDPQVLYWEDLIPPEGMEALEEAYAAAAENSAAPQSDLPESSDIVPGADPDDPSGTKPAATQIGTFHVVEELNGKSVRIPGYMIPFDINQMSEVKEFLLVPYFGACIHVPPPPPNQIIYVVSDEAVAFGWEPVWLEGVLETSRKINDLGSAAYTLNLSKLEPYTDG
jgi:uncharacterized protein